MSGIIKKIHFDHFRGTSGIDIDLRRLDIDQCPLPPGSTQLNIFAASDKCKKRTTEVSTFTFTFSSRQEYIRLDANNFQMMKFQMYVAKISKNHPSSTRFVGKKKKKKIRLFHSTTRFLYQHLIIVPLQCIAIPGLGFRRGSYRCICKRGFYYPDIKSTNRYYNGTVIEEEFEKLMMVSFLLFFFSLKHFRKNSIRVFFISQITTVENFICKKNPF